MAGYCLTSDEIKELYIRWGFSMKRRTMSDHLDTWTEIGWTWRFNSGANGSAIYYFSLDERDEQPLVRTLETSFPDMASREGFNGLVIA